MTTTDLAPRQLEVLELLAQGLTNPEIAIRLGLSLSTVTNTLSMVFARIGVDNRVKAAQWLRDHQDQVPVA